MPTIGQRIKRKRKEMGYSQEELASLLNSKYDINTCRTTITKWETDVQTPRAFPIKCMAEIFGTSVDWIISGKESSPQPSNIEDAPVHFFPVIGSIAAGYNGLAMEEETGEIVPVPLSALHHLPPGEFFVLQVKGDSMVPMFSSGDKVLVHRCSSVDSGSIAVVRYHGEEATLKKITYQYGEDWFDMTPLNPAYPKIRISGAELEQCQVLGKAVMKLQDVGPVRTMDANRKALLDAVENASEEQLKTLLRLTQAFLAQSGE